jgi:phage terminase small subunit
VCCIIIIIKQ